MTYDGTTRTAHLEIGLFTEAIAKLDGDRKRVADALRFIDDREGLKAPADGTDYIEDLIDDIDNAFAQATDVADRLYEASQNMSDATYAATN